jgi:hypothetical protein
MVTSKMTPRARDFEVNERVPVRPVEVSAKVHLAWLVAFAAAGSATAARRRTDAMANATVPGNPREHPISDITASSAALRLCFQPRRAIPLARAENASPTVASSPTISSVSI